MTRIVLDARKLADFGIGSYVRGLVAAMAAARADWRFVLLVDPASRAAPEWPSNVATVADRSANYGLAELRSIARRAHEAGADLFHSPHYVYPAGLRCPGVVTIHDCIHLRFPGQLPRPGGFLPRNLARRYALGMMRHAGRSAARVITVSEASAADLVERVGVRRERLTVVPNGCDPIFRRPATEAEIAAAEQVVPTSAPYVLYLGNDKPHKNLGGLERAVASLADEPSLGLVIVGAPRDTGRGPAPERVHVVGRLDAGTLRGVLARARMVAVPSLWEGFGLPALEAMAAGVPVVTSDAGALPEVVGDAALRVPAGDDHALAEALRALRDDAALHRRLAAAGPTRAAAFTWERAAERTLAVYEAVLGGSSG